MENNNTYIDNFMENNACYFEAHKLYFIRRTLEQADKSKLKALQGVVFADPNTTLLSSIVLPGIDRFMINSVNIGFVKLFLIIFIVVLNVIQDELYGELAHVFIKLLISVSLLMSFVLYVKDIVFIQTLTKRHNLNTLLTILN